VAQQSLLFRYGVNGNGNGKVLEEQQQKELKNRFLDINDKRCTPSLPVSEINQIWKDAVAYYTRQKKEGKQQLKNGVEAAAEVSVSEAIRRKKGYVRVKGQLMGYS
jgi:hypothetical protein